MQCLQCGIEFESKRPTAKFCSPKCRVTHNRSVTLTSDSVTLSDPDVTLDFKFTVTYNRKPGEPGYDSDVEAKRKQVRTAKYWYDVPLAAIPVRQKNWPPMPSFMNGRQYFLWWKNEFETAGRDSEPNLRHPVIHNPFPPKDNIRYEMGGEGARRWGA